MKIHDCKVIVVEDKDEASASVKPQSLLADLADLVEGVAAPLNRIEATRPAGAKCEEVSRTMRDVDGDVKKLASIGERIGRRIGPVLNPPRTIMPRGCGKR